MASDVVVGFFQRAAAGYCRRRAGLLQGAVRSPAAVDQKARGGSADETGMSAIPPTVLPPAPAPLPPVAADPVGGPLLPEHLQQLAQANQRAAKLRKAGGVALFNAVTVGIFAGASLLFALVSPLFGEWDLLALAMGLGFAAVAWNEFRGRKLIRGFDPRGPGVLGWNQLGLMGLLIGYCAWQIAKAWFGPNPYAEAIERGPMLASTLGPLGDLYKTLTIVVYGAVIAGTVLFQGLNALYYFTRRKHLVAYLDETPPWVVQLQRHSLRV